MTLAYHATKLVVGDLAVAERFYRAIGLKVVSRNLGGEADVRQEQCWLSATGDASAHLLILSRFVELPPPHAPAYPGEVWLARSVPRAPPVQRTSRWALSSSRRPGTAVKRSAATSSASRPETKLARL